ncbi:MAG: hypothetical protein ACRDJW_17030 [Thermomicrobiales bacterium]
MVDDGGAVSFVGPCHALKALAAACSRGAADHRGLLGLLGEYDGRLSERLIAGLRVFDEHNTSKDRRAVHHWLAETEPIEAPPFRVVDDVTRRASLQPVRYGLVVFNLNARRIVQVQNSYDNLKRADRGRVRVAGQPTRRLYRYHLSEEWSIVP